MVGEDRGVDAASELPQLIERPAQLLASPLQLPRASGSPSIFDAAPQTERERDEALLSAVVQVALRRRRAASLD